MWKNTCNKKKKLCMAKPKKNICTFSCSKWKISRKKYENVVLFSIPQKTFRFKFQSVSQIFNFHSCDDIHFRFGNMKYFVRIFPNFCSVDTRTSMKHAAWRHRRTREKNMRNFVLREFHLTLEDSDQMNTSIKSISEFFPQHKMQKGMNFSEREKFEL